MIEKDSIYWSIHKIVFEELYYDLDNNIKSIIANNAECKESILLKQKVDDEVKKRLTQG